MDLDLYTINLWINNLIIQFLELDSCSTRASSSWMPFSRPFKVRNVYCKLPCLSNCAIIAFLCEIDNEVEDLPDFKIPRSMRSCGSEFQAWTSGNENLPSSRSSQKPLPVVYYFDVSIFASKLVFFETYRIVSQVLIVISNLEILSEHGEEIQWNCSKMSILERSRFLLEDLLLV